MRGKLSSALTRSASQLERAVPASWLWRTSICLLISAAVALALQGQVHLRFLEIPFPSQTNDRNLLPRILLVIRTCPKFYETRLRDALDTHGRYVPANLLLPVGNTPYSVAVHSPSGAARIIDVAPTDGSNTGGVGVCEDNHGVGIVCIEGRALYYAYERQHDFDWVFVVDDDVYVHRKNLEQVVLTLNEDVRLVYTIGGCAQNVTCARNAGGGICGGGGWLLSKKNLVRGIEHDGGDGSGYSNNSVRLERKTSGKHTNLADWMSAWTETGAGVAREDGSWWSDITAGCVLHERGGISVKELPGLHPWTVERKKLDQELTHGSPAPITYHYVGREEVPKMRALHHLAVNPPSPTKFGMNVTNQTL
jgi:hypothetical protein